MVIIETIFVMNYSKINKLYFQGQFLLQISKILYAITRVHFLLLHIRSHGGYAFLRIFDLNTGNAWRAGRGFLRMISAHEIQHGVDPRQSVFFN